MFWVEIAESENMPINTHENSLTQYDCSAVYHITTRDGHLSIIVIAQNSLDLSITVIAFVIYFVIADKLSR